MASKVLSYPELKDGIGTSKMCKLVSELVYVLTLKPPLGTRKESNSQLLNAFCSHAADVSLVKGTSG